MAKTKKSSKSTKGIKGVDPAFLEKRKASMRRTHRQVLYLNQKEMDAIDEYCKRFNVKSRASLLREAIMERILSQLEENHPTLF